MVKKFCVVFEAIGLSGLHRSESRKKSDLRTEDFYCYRIIQNMQRLFYIFYLLLAICENICLMSGMQKPYSASVPSPPPSLSFPLSGSFLPPLCDMRRHLNDKMHFNGVDHIATKCKTYQTSS